MNVIRLYVLLMNIFTILTKEIIMKIITSSNNDHINNIINDFFYPK